ncbi:unnamed protein product, partial [Vitis vinifera]
MTRIAHQFTVGILFEQLYRFGFLISMIGFVFPRANALGTTFDYQFLRGFVFQIPFTFTTFINPTYSKVFPFLPCSYYGYYCFASYQLIH